MLGGLCRINTACVAYHAPADPATASARARRASCTGPPPCSRECGCAPSGGTPWRRRWHGRPVAQLPERANNPGESSGTAAHGQPRADGRSHAHTHTEHTPARARANTLFSGPFYSDSFFFFILFSIFSCAPVHTVTTPPRTVTHTRKRAPGPSHRQPPPSSSLGPFSRAGETSGSRFLPLPLHPSYDRRALK